MIISVKNECIEGGREFVVRIFCTLVFGMQSGSGTEAIFYIYTALKLTLLAGY